MRWPQSAMLQWLRGERLLLSPARVDLGRVVGNQEIEFQLELRNLTLRPVTLVGAQRSCQCISVSEFPLVVPPSRTVQLPMRIVAPADAGNFLQSLKLFTDFPERSQLPVEVYGTVP